MDYTQANVSVLAQQALAANTPGAVIGSAVDVSTYLAGIVRIYKGKTATTADLVAGLDYIELQSSPDATGNNWSTVRRIIPTATAALTCAATSTCDAGATEFTATTTAAFAGGDWVFITDATDEAANSEWAMVNFVHTNAHVTIVDGLAFAKAAGDDMYSQAEIWPIYVSFEGIQRIRVIAQHAGATGSGWVIKADLECATDIE